MTLGKTQLAQDWRNGGRSYIRGQNNGTWSGWSQLWSSADFTNNSSNWDTAYGWGNHASAGYITDGNTNWNNTYGFITSSDSSITNKLPLAGGTLTGSLRAQANLNYFGLASGNNEGEIIINTGEAGSPQIGFTEHGDASWAIGIDDADNSFKMHGTANSTIPTINNLAIPLFEITTTAGTAYLNNSRIFTDAYHPNADKWTTARTLTLSGDVTGSVSFDGSANASMTATVANNSHTHNNLSNYYLATNPDGYTSNVGDITGVTAGTGMTGGGTSGSVTLNVIGGTGITANANDIAVDSTVLRTTGNQTKDAILNTRNSAIDDETLFAITDSDDTASVRAKFYTTSTTITKVDDATAPASGVFKITGSFSATWGEYIPMDDETEIMFECWIKHVSGTDTTGNFYAGGEFYNGSKTSYGNTQRYWGANGDVQDSDTPNPPRWRHIKGVMHGGAIRAQASTPDAQYVRLLVLANYNAGGNASHFCGFRFYRSKKNYFKPLVKNT